MSRSHSEFLSKYLHLAQTNVRCCITVVLNKCSSNQACRSFGEVAEAAAAAAGRSPAGGHASSGSAQVYCLRSLQQRKSAGLCAGSLHCVIDYHIWCKPNSSGRHGKTQVRVWDFSFGSFILFCFGCCARCEEPKLQSSVRFFQLHMVS